MSLRAKASKATGEYIYEVDVAARVPLKRNDITVNNLTWILLTILQ